MRLVCCKTILDRQAERLTRAAQVTVHVHGASDSPVLSAHHSTQLLNAFVQVQSLFLSLVCGVRIML